MRKARERTTYQLGVVRRRRVCEEEGEERFFSFLFLFLSFLYTRPEKRTVTEKIVRRWTSNEDGYGGRFNGEALEEEYEGGGERLSVFGDAGPGSQLGTRKKCILRCYHHWDAGHGFQHMPVPTNTKELVIILLDMSAPISAFSRAVFFFLFFFLLFFKEKMGR
eukprot:TRINITY_DN2245_c0_g1_i3.p1 TRINITY_DN2245_c0_g1~~TRINITY_DN2245_c0_g1_i3.p1  ORF type:complete len:164 (+),score=9.76 TRINITY_DN2245_c0_g1_i3:878-1369(+)